MQYMDMRGILLPFEQNRDFYLRRGRMHLDEGNDWEALPLLLRAHEMDPDDGDTSLLLAEVYSEMGCNDLACQVLFNMLWQCQELPQQYEYLLGCELLLQQDFERAIPAFQRFNQQDIDDKEIRLEMNEVSQILENIDIGSWEDTVNEQATEENSSHILIRQGDRDMEAGEYETALNAFRQAYELSPLSEEISTSLALGLWTSGDNEEAEKICREILNEHSDNMRAHCLMAMIYDQNGNEVLKQEQLDIIMELAYEDVNETFCAAVAVGELGEHELAAKLLPYCEDIQPYNQNILHASAVNALMLGNEEGARQAWSRLRRIMSDDPILLFYLHSLDDGRDLEHMQCPYFFALPEDVAKSYVEKIELLSNPFQKWPAHDESTEMEIDEILRWTLQQESQTLLCAASMVAVRFGQWQRAKAIVMLREALVCQTGLHEKTRQSFADALYALGATEPYFQYCSDGAVALAVPLAGIEKRWVGDAAVVYDCYRKNSSNEQEEQTRVFLWLWNLFLHAMGREKFLLGEPEYYTAALYLLVRQCIQTEEQLEIETVARKFGVAESEVAATLIMLEESLYPHEAMQK